MGLFGGNRRKALGSAIDIGAIQDQARLEGDGTLPTMPKRPGIFSKGGKGWDVLGGTADTLLQMRGGPPVYNDGSSERLRQLILQAQIAQQTHQANRQFDIENPLPQQPDAFERSLEQSGVQPGTPEWMAAMADRAGYLRNPPRFVTMADGSVRQIGGPYRFPGQTSSPEPTQEDINGLLKGVGTDEQFDEIYGAGSAARIKGGAGQQAPRPFP